jgi:hypothetical protein
MKLSAAAVVLLGVACGGGGGGGPTEPPPPPPGVSFTPDGVSGPGTLVLRRSDSTTAERLVLELVATQVSGVYGIAFDLQYPTSVLQLDSVREEPFLSAGGSVQTALQVAESPAGNLVVGHTRLGPAPGVGGSGTMLTLTFRVLAAGTGALRFTGNEVFDAAGVPLGGIQWGAGTVTVNR